MIWVAATWRIVLRQNSLFFRCDYECIFVSMYRQSHDWLVHMLCLLKQDRSGPVNVNVFDKPRSVIDIYPAPDRGDGVLFSSNFSVSLFVSFFVSLSARLWENGWTDLHEIFREGVEWPWDDLITFWVSSGKRHDAITPYHYENTAGPICMKFSGKVRSDHGTTWLNFGSIRVNRAMPRC